MSVPSTGRSSAAKNRAAPRRRAPAAGSRRRPATLRMPSRPFLRPLFRRRIIELGQADRAHQRRVGFERQSARSHREAAARFMDRDAAQQTFRQVAACASTFAPRARSTRTASRVTSVPMPSPGRTRIFRFICVEFVFQPARGLRPSVGGHLLGLRLFDQRRRSLRPARPSCDRPAR